VKQKTFRALMAILTLCLMSGIFFMSSQEADLSNQMSGPMARLAARILTPGFDQLSPQQQDFLAQSHQHWVRKCAHLAEYALLAFFICLSLPLKGKTAPRTAFALAVTFAALDELHQTMVPGRSGQLSDVLIDAGGALLGAAWAMVFLHRITHAGSRRSGPHERPQSPRRDGR